MRRWAFAAGVTAWTSRPVRWSKKAWRSASSPPRASASRARSSRCVRSTSAASVSTTSKKATSRPSAAASSSTRGSRWWSPPKGSGSCSRGTAKFRSSTRKAARWRSTKCPPEPSSRSPKTKRQGRARSLCEWDPHSIPILAETGGKVRFEDLIDGTTMRSEKDPSGHIRYVIMEHKGDLHPQVVARRSGRRQDSRLLLHARTGPLGSRRRQMITPGTMVAKTPREASGTQDITGGLPRVTEIFEARKPKDPAVIAEIDGTVELLAEKKRGKRSIIVRSESGIEREHLDHAQQALARPLGRHRASRRRAGRWSARAARHSCAFPGEEAVQQYLPAKFKTCTAASASKSTTSTSRSSSPMLRKVRIESRRHDVAARQRDRQVRVPPGSTMRCQVREDRRSGRQRVARRDIVPRTLERGQLPKSRRSAARLPKAPGRRRRLPARSCWASPRRRCKARASSRPPASRKRPRC